MNTNTPAWYLKFSIIIIIHLFLSLLVQLQKYEAHVFAVVGVIYCVISLFVVCSWYYDC